MPMHTETNDWLGKVNFSVAETKYGYLQPGHSASGTVSVSDTKDLIKVPMATGQAYRFDTTGKDVTVQLIDDSGTVLAQGSVIEFTPVHPSEHYYIRVKGTGAYTVKMDGVAADNAVDEDILSSGISTPKFSDLDVGERRTAVINGNNQTDDADHFRTWLDAGKTYKWMMTPAQSAFGASAGGLLTLYNSIWSEQSTNYSASAWDSGAWLSFTPTQSGFYYIKTETYYGFNNAGSYVVSVDDTADTLPTGNVKIKASWLSTDGSGAWFLNTKVARAANGSTPPDRLTLDVDLVDGQDAGQSRLIEKSFKFQTGDKTEIVTVRLGKPGGLKDVPAVVSSLDDVETHDNNGLNATQSFASVGLDGIKLRGGLGDDLLLGSTGSDKLRGAAGKDDIRGSGGDDRLEGGGGEDTLNGGNGDDRLVGGANGDLLEGGKGDDILEGGGGRDVFLFNQGDGSDKLKDVELGRDKIEIDKGANTMSDLKFKQKGDDVLLRYGDGDKVLVQDVTVAQLDDASNFIL